MCRGSLQACEGWAKDVLAPLARTTAHSSAAAPAVASATAEAPWQLRALGDANGEECCPAAETAATALAPDDDERAMETIALALARRVGRGSFLPMPAYPITEGGVRGRDKRGTRETSPMHPSIPNPALALVTAAAAAGTFAGRGARTVTPPSRRLGPEMPGV